MKLLFAFSAVVAAVAGVRQEATGDATLTKVDYIPSESFLENVDANKFDTVEHPETGQQVCSPKLYIGKSLPTTNIFEVNGAGNALNTLGPTNCYEDQIVGYNAMGYDVNTNFIYGVTDHEHSTDKHHIVRINRHGCTEPVAEIGSLGAVDHSGNRHIAGDIFQGTTYWVGQGKRFRAVNLAPVDGELAYFSWEFPVCTRMNDFAFSPKFFKNGDLTSLAGDAFGWDLVENKLCRFTSAQGGLLNPMPELLSDFGITLPANAIIGGLFFDFEGSVWMYDNKNDNLHKFEGLDAAIEKWNNNDFSGTVTQTSLLNVGGGEDNNNNIDGCSCPQSPGKFIDTVMDDRCTGYLA